MSTTFVWKSENVIPQDANSSYGFVFTFSSETMTFPILIREIEIDFSPSVFRPCPYQGEYIFPPLFSRLIISGSNTTDVYLDQSFPACRNAPCSVFNPLQTFRLQRPLRINTPFSSIHFFFYNTYCPVKLALSKITFHYDTTLPQAPETPQQAPQPQAPQPQAPQQAPQAPQAQEEPEKKLNLVSEPVFWILLGITIFLFVLIALKIVMSYSQPRPQLVSQSLSRPINNSLSVRS